MKSLNPLISVVQTIYIIVKARGGELKVKTREEDSTFIIHLRMAGN